jgi:hypothetical protein
MRRFERKREISKKRDKKVIRTLRRKGNAITAARKDISQGNVDPPGPITQNPTTPNKNEAEE